MEKNKDCSNKCKHNSECNKKKYTNTESTAENTIPYNMPLMDRVYPPFRHLGFNYFRSMYFSNKHDK